MLELERFFSDDFYDYFCKNNKIPRNSKSVHLFIKFFLEHREYMRYGKIDKVAIAYNKDKNKIELFRKCNVWKKVEV